MELLLMELVRAQSTIRGRAINKYSEAFRVMQRSTSRTAGSDTGLCISFAPGSTLYSRVHYDRLPVSGGPL